MAGFAFTQVFSYEILYTLFRNNGLHSKEVLLLLSTTFVTVQLSSILSIQVLISINKSSDLFLPSLLIALLNIVLCSISVMFFKHIGAAFSVALIEIFLLLYFNHRVLFYGIKLFSHRFFIVMTKYLLMLFLLLLGLRMLYGVLPFNMLIKLFIVIVIYGVGVLTVLHVMRLVNLNLRKISILAAY